MICIFYIKFCIKGEVFWCIVVNSEVFLIKFQIDWYSFRGRGVDYGIIWYIVKVDCVDVLFINKVIFVIVQVFEIYCISIFLLVVVEVGCLGNRVVGIREDCLFGIGIIVVQFDIDQVINIRQVVFVCVIRLYVIGLCVEVIWGVCIDSFIVSVCIVIGCLDGQVNGCCIVGQFKEGVVVYWEV